jgi:hypothetical protein
MIEDGIRCPLCSSSEVTQPTLFDPSEGYSRVWFLKKDAKAGWLETDRESFTVTRARVCLGCGHVMLALDGDLVAQLRHRLPNVAPVPEEK